MTTLTITPRPVEVRVQATAAIDCGIFGVNFIMPSTPTKVYYKRAKRTIQ